LHCNLQSSAEVHWFNDKFREFRNPGQLSFDQHFLLALTADPERYYLITAEVEGGDWINTPAMYVTYLAARRAYEALGIANNLGIYLHWEQQLFLPGRNTRLLITWVFTCQDMPLS